MLTTFDAGTIRLPTRPRKNARFDHGYIAQPLPGPGGLVDVQVGASDWGCGRQKSGSVLCWQTPLAYPGGPLPAARLRPVPGISDAVDVATGFASACIVRPTGKIDCVGALRHPLQPLSEIGVSDAVRVSMSKEGLFKCFLRKTGTVACMDGWNGWGERGDGPLGLRGPYPTDVAGLADVARVGVGNQHACAVKKSGRVACWGDNTHGQVTGTGPGPFVAPAAVKGLPAVAP